MSTQSPREHAVPSRLLEMAQEVAPNVDIVGVRLVDMRAKVSAPVLSSGPFAFRTGHRTQATHIGETDTLAVTIEFDFALATDEKTKQLPPVEIRATFALTYNVRDLVTFDEEHRQAFGYVNGAYNAWPFWRELVYSTLARMGVPPITLPVFRVVPTDEPNIDSATPHQP